MKLINISADEYKNTSRKVSPCRSPHPGEKKDAYVVTDVRMTSQILETTTKLKQEKKSCSLPVALNCILSLCPEDCNLNSTEKKMTDLQYVYDKQEV